MKCRGCGAEIEHNEAGWWIVGTCRSTCYGVNGEWMAHVPDLSDIEAVQEWVDA